MTAENSFLLPYRLATLERDYGPYMRGAVWADPDLDEAARLMRLVVEQPDEGRRAAKRRANTSPGSAIRRSPARPSERGSKPSALAMVIPSHE